MFDITSGVLRKAGKFDGSDNLPAPDVANVFMPYIGWKKLSITRVQLYWPKTWN